MPEQWREWYDECNECGSESEVLTKAPTGAYDGDEVRCTECGNTGCISADEDGCCTVWHEKSDDGFRN